MRFRLAQDFTDSFLSSQFSVSVAYFGEKKGRSFEFSMRCKYHLLPSFCLIIYPLTQRADFFVNEIDLELDHHFSYSRNRFDLCFPRNFQ